MYRTSFLGLAGIVLGVLILLSSCSGKRSAPVKEKEKRALSCIAVTLTETPVNRKEKISYEQAQALEKGAAFVDGLLAEQLSGSSRYRFATQKQMDAAYSSKMNNKLEHLKKVAGKLSCDGALTTFVDEYRQRIGSSYSVDTAASISIQMKLISVADGQVLWNGSFQETQEPLFSNLFSLGKISRRGLKWLTVEELTTSGVEELLKGCPYMTAD